MRDSAISRPEPHPSTEIKGCDLGMNGSGGPVIRAVACSRQDCVFPATVVARAEGHQFHRAALCSADYVKHAAGYRESYAVLGLKLSWSYVNGESPVARLRTVVEIVEARRALGLSGELPRAVRSVLSRRAGQAGAHDIAVQSCG